MLAQSTINQAIILLVAAVFCVGTVTMLSWTKDLLFYACRVVRRMWK